MLKSEEVKPAGSARSRISILERSDGRDHGSEANLIMIRGPCKKVKDLKQTPVNRFSIGIQSFFDDDLAWMNRVHRADEAEASVKRAQDAGFENITVDLIYGYPLLTDQKWKYNLDKVFALQIPHISSYSMTVEPRTALASFIKKEKAIAYE